MSLSGWSKVVETTGSRAPLDFLRHVMQHRPRWVLLFAGAHTVEDLAPLWSDYLIHARALRVSYLDTPDARELIVRPVDDFPDIYEREAVEDIIRWTSCQPYLVQLLCTEVVERLNRERRQRATADDVEMVIPRAFETGAHYFREFWALSATPEERKVLLALARDGEMPEGVPEAVIRALVRREVVDQADGGYRFQVPLVRRWVRRKGWAG